MRVYEIYDEENNISIGTLLYYEKEQSYIIELCAGVDEWTAPLLFTSLVRKGIYTVPREISFLWVKERIIPSGRQNINSLLKTHKMKEYNEMTLLELSEGRCIQDSLCIKKLDAIPDYVLERMEENVVECFLTERNELICFFVNEVMKKIDLTKLVAVENLDKVLQNKMLLESVKIGTGGYSVTFNDSIDIPAEVLYQSGETIPLSLRDFVMFAKHNMVDTSEACDILECSRQNLSYLVKEERLEPIKMNVKGNLYLKGDVVENKW